MVIMFIFKNATLQTSYYFSFYQKSLLLHEIFILIFHFSKIISINTRISLLLSREKVTCPTSEIAKIILSLKFIGSFEAAAFSVTNFFFPPGRSSLLSSHHSLCCLPHFAPTPSRKKRAAKKILSVFSAMRNTRVD